MQSFDPRRILPSNWRKLSGLPPNVPLGQPYLHVFRNAAQSFSAATNTTVLFDSVTADTAGFWDATNKRYTPQIAGRYLVVTAITVAVGATAQNGALALAQIRLNGSGQHYDSLNAPVATSAVSNNTAFVTNEIQCNGSTDYIDVLVYSDGASPGVTGNFKLSWMEIHYLGP